MEALEATKAHFKGVEGVSPEVAAAYALGYKAALAPATAAPLAAAAHNPARAGGEEGEEESEAEIEAKLKMAMAAREGMKIRRAIRSRSYDSESGSPSVYKYDPQLRIRPRIIPKQLHFPLLLFLPHPLLFLSGFSFLIFF